MQSLELELKEPFAGWLSVFITLGWLSLTSTHTVHTRNWHSDLHPRNVFASRLKQYIWPYAIQEVQPSRVYGRLPYLPPESEQAGSKRNPKWDVYAFGIIMWQLVSRVTFPSDQYMDHDVYRIDRIPGVPEWYEQLYISCLNKDPEARPDMAVLRRQFSQYTRNSTMIFRKNPEPEPFQVEKELRDYQRLRAEMITIHLETCLAPSNISLQSSSDFYSREQLSNYIGFRLVSL
jgi:serine/threonine protein kinase